ncbi:MAG: hypothetical protein ACOVKS_13085 [Aquimonas sp.]
MLVLAVGFCLGFGDWLCGAIGLITPVLMLGPLLALAGVVLMLTLLVGWLGIAAVRNRPLRVLVLDLLCLLLAATISALGPSLQQGFAWRIAATPEADWLRLAEDARALARASTADGRLPKRAHFDQNRRLLPELGKHHAFLRLWLDAPNKLFITDSAVALDWGNGLSGPMEIGIHVDPVNAADTPHVLYTTQRILPRVVLTWE